MFTSATEFYTYGHTFSLLVALRISASNLNGPNAEMFEEAFLRVGQRLGALQAWVIVALGLAVVTPLGLAGLAAYAWYHPAAFCRQQSSSLFFGAGLPDGGTVTPEDWARFVDTAIAAQIGRAHV